MTTPLRIAFGRLMQETNSFSSVPTTRDDFARNHLVAGEDRVHDLAARVRVGRSSMVAQGRPFVGRIPGTPDPPFVAARQGAGELPHE